MTDILLKHRSVVLCGLIVGFTGALWHVIPFIQTHNTPVWIFWQCLYSVIYRVLFTKVYLLTDRSVFGMIAAHATYNTAFSLMPYYGSSYSPMYMSFAALFITGIVFALFWLSRNAHMTLPNESG